jgi:hypothetical protein
MSIDHVSRVLALGPEVSGTDRMVLFVLAEAANADTDECWPSMRTIAKRAGLRQERYVSKALAALTEKGLISVDPNGCPDSRIRADRRPNLYKMTGAMAVLDGGARRAPEDDAGVRDTQDDPARRASTGGRDAQSLPHIEPEGEPSPERTPAVTTGDRFDEFYAEYPRKRDPEAARRAWIKALRKATADEIIAGARRYAEERRGQDPQFTKHPATWLNAGSWANTVDAAAGPKLSQSTRSLAAWAQRREQETPSRKAIG